MAEHLVAVLEFKSWTEPGRVGVDLQGALGQLDTQRCEFGDVRSNFERAVSDLSDPSIVT